jgi:hypothetical protein
MTEGTALVAKTKRSKLGWIAVGVGVVVIVVGGLVWRWWDQMGSGARVALAQAYEDVRPGQLGTVVVDRSTGSGRVSDDLPSRYIGVVVPDPDEAAVVARTETLLQDAGFTTTSGRKAGEPVVSDTTTATGRAPGPQPVGYWERRKDGHLATIAVDLVPAGGRVKQGTKPVPEGSTGIVLYFVGG